MVCTLYKGVNELETPTKTIFLAPIYLGSKSHFSRHDSGCILHPFAQKASGQVLETRVLYGCIVDTTDGCLVGERYKHEENNRPESDDDDDEEGKEGEGRGRGGGVYSSIVSVR